MMPRTFCVNRLTSFYVHAAVYCHHNGKRQKNIAAFVDADVLQKCPEYFKPQKFS